MNAHKTLNRAFSFLQQRIPNPSICRVYNSNAHELHVYIFPLKFLFPFLYYMVLGHESKFLKPSNTQAQVKTQESQSPRSYQALSLRGQVSNPRRNDSRPRAQFDTSEALESKASETFKSEDFESEALTSKILEFRDWGCKFIWMMCGVILSIQFKCQIPENTESNTLSTGIRNSNAITTKSYLDLLRSRDR